MIKIRNDEAVLVRPDAFVAWRSWDRSEHPEARLADVVRPLKLNFDKAEISR